MKKNKETPFVVVLGIAQDGGYPQAGCNEDCCENAYSDPLKKKNVSCLALVDPKSNKQWIFDATPDLKFQLNLLKKKSGINALNGVFLTHAHIGHYTGLVNFGNEVMESNNMPVYSMKKMGNFIRSNAPWNQLVKNKNIDLKILENGSNIELANGLNITPLLVPHRDENSETVGYKIASKNKSLVFIPDIDKWDLWKKSIVDEVKSVDYAFLDATFFSGDEINRSMKEIPHPFVLETIDIFMDEDLGTKNKIHFIHFNHTNPLLNQKTNLRDSILKLGFNFAKFGDKYNL